MQAFSYKFRYKDGNLIPKADDRISQKVSAAGVSTLTITSVSGDQAGFYECEISNGGLSKRTGSRLTVEQQAVAVPIFQ